MHLKVYGCKEEVLRFLAFIKLMSRSLGIELRDKLVQLALTSDNTTLVIKYPVPTHVADKNTKLDK